MRSPPAAAATPTLQPPRQANTQQCVRCVLVSCSSCRPPEDGPAHGCSRRAPPPHQAHESCCACIKAEQVRAQSICNHYLLTHSCSLYPSRSPPITPPLGNISVSMSHAHDDDYRLMARDAHDLRLLVAKTAFGILLLTHCAQTQDSSVRSRPQRRPRAPLAQSAATAGAGAAPPPAHRAVTMHYVSHMATLHRGSTPAAAAAVATVIRSSSTTPAAAPGSVAARQSRRRRLSKTAASRWATTRATVATCTAALSVAF
jgi:hypothetical protein